MATLNVYPFKGNVLWLAVVLLVLSVNKVQWTHQTRHDIFLSAIPVDATSQELLDHAGSAVRSDTSQPRKPNLNDIVDFLSSEDIVLVSNAASYLQHLAYGDDSMKTKKRSVLFPFLFLPVFYMQNFWTCENFPLYVCPDNYTVTVTETVERSDIS